MKTVIEINMDNEAFQDEWGGGFSGSDEVARILAKTAKAIDGNRWFGAGYSFPLFDSNGNEVGYCTVREG